MWGPKVKFTVKDWKCSSCGNINFAKRSHCNVCNAPKNVALSEPRTGYGGGFSETGDIEYKETRGQEEGEYDDFGRKRKKFRSSKPNDAPRESGRAGPGESGPRFSAPAAVHDGGDGDDDDDDDDVDDDDEDQYNFSFLATEETKSEKTTVDRPSETSREDSKQDERPRSDNRDRDERDRGRDRDERDRDRDRDRGTERDTRYESDRRDRDRDDRDRRDRDRDDRGHRDEDRRGGRGGRDDRSGPDTRRDGSKRY